MNKRILRAAKERCRLLRTKSTKAERLLWAELRERRLESRKFLRQHPLFFKYRDGEAFFIADFYCHTDRLVVEVDGKIHEAFKDYDALRTELISRLNISIVRFKNEEIERDIKGVLERLRGILNRTHPRLRRSASGGSRDSGGAGL